MHTWGRFVYERSFMSAKKFTTIQEQIEILKSRGLSIPDEEKASDFLTRNNYYRVSGYSLTLRKNDVFDKNAAFENIIEIYECDHELRHILLKHLEAIEISVKSAYSYEFAKTYGPTGYLNSANFTDQKKYTVIMEKAESQKKARLPHEAYLKHFVSDLKQNIPIWAFTDLLTISDISFLYKISQKDIKIAVAKTMGLNVQGDRLLEKFMHSMTIIRNLCAHGSRLYNRLFEQKPRLSNKDKALLIKKADGTLDNAHLYGFILIMRQLLSPEEFNTLKEELVILSEKYSFVNMEYYGFRNDWKSSL